MNHARLLRWSAALVVALAPAFPREAPAAPAASRAPLATALRSDLQAYLRNRRSAEHISAASLTVSLADRSTIDVAAGTDRFDGGPPVTPASLFQIGSNTKAFTAVLALKLQSAGKLSLHQTIGAWLPQYPAWRSISLYRLLEMTSGLPTYDSTQAWETAYVRDPQHFFTAAELVGYVYPQAPRKDPWLYSNTGYLLWQMIVGKAASADYTTVLHRDVLAPSGIGDLYYYPGLYPPALRARTVSGYYFNDDPDDRGLWPLLRKDVRDDGTSWAQAAGGIVGTPHAVALWARDLYQGDVLTARERAQLERLVSTSTGRPVASVGPGHPRGFGLGVSQVYKPGLGTFWFYEGETLGYRMVHVYFPKQDVVLAVALNSQPRSNQDQIGALVADLVATLRSYGRF